MTHQFKLIQISDQITRSKIDNEKSISINLVTVSMFRTHVHVPTLEMTTVNHYNDFYLHFYTSLLLFLF